MGAGQAIAGYRGRMSRRVSPALAVLATLLALGGSAAGDGGPARPSDPSTADAAPGGDAVRRGEAARRLGRWTEVAAAYAEALAATEAAGLRDDKRAAILGELGAAEVEMGKYRDGAEHLHRSLLHEEALTAGQKARFRKAERKAMAEIAILFVAVNPSDAELLIDNKPIPQRASSHILFVEPGQHTLRARHPGHEESMIRHNAPKGTEASLALRLNTVPPPPPKPRPRERQVVIVKEPEGEGWTRFRAPVMVTAGGALMLGGGLLGAAIAVDDAIEDRTADLGARAGLGACNTGRHEAECNELGALVDTRDALATMGRGALLIGVGLGVVGIGSFAFGSDNKGRARVALLPGGVVLHGDL